MLHVFNFCHITVWRLVRVTTRVLRPWLHISTDSTICRIDTGGVLAEQPLHVLQGGNPSQRRHTGKLSAFRMYMFQNKVIMYVYS